MPKRISSPTAEVRPGIAGNGNALQVTEPDARGAHDMIDRTRGEGRIVLDPSPQPLLGDGRHQSSIDDERGARVRMTERKSQH